MVDWRVVQLAVTRRVPGPWELKAWYVGGGGVAIRCCSVVFRFYSGCISVVRRLFIGHISALHQLAIKASRVRSGLDRSGVVSIEGQNDESASLDKSPSTDCFSLCAGFASPLGFARRLHSDFRREVAQWLARECENRP